MAAKVSKSDTAYSITISSYPPSQGSMTVWALRDFVRVLDEEGIPDSATLVADHNDTRHFTGLRVHHTVVVDTPTGGTA